MKLSILAPLVGGTLHGADRDVSSFGSDTRSLQAGDVFIALSGANFDANDFIADAAARGAVAALVSRPDSRVDIPQLVVADTLAALGLLAQAAVPGAGARCHYR